MPNRFVHCVTGVTAGSLAAAYKAHGQKRHHTMIEIAGGAAAGYLGARLPDIIDPPTSPNHRGIGHGALTATGAGVGIASIIDECQAWLRAGADEMRCKAESEENPALKASYQIAEYLLRALAGAIAGFVLGYGSHLFLDGFSPSGLPLLA